MKPIRTSRWKVFCNKLRPKFSVEVIEIQTLDGNAVIGWMGFDDSSLPKMTRIKIAEHVVKLHNDSLHPQS